MTKINKRKVTKEVNNKIKKLLKNNKHIREKLLNERSEILNEMKKKKKKTENNPENNLITSLRNLLNQKQYHTIIGDNFNEWFNNMNDTQKINFHTELTKCSVESKKIKKILKTKKMYENKIKNGSSKKTEENKSFNNQKQKKKLWNESDIGKEVKCKNNKKKSMEWKESDGSNDCEQKINKEMSLVKVTTNGNGSLNNSSLLRNFLNNLDEQWETDEDDGDFLHNSDLYDLENDTDSTFSDGYIDHNEYEDDLDEEDTDSDEFTDDFDDDNKDGDYESDEYEFVNSDEDEEIDSDYIPDIDEDLYIGRGEAKIYNIPNNVKTPTFKDETSQIIELNQSISDDSDCPELIPIYPNVKKQKIDLKTNIKSHKIQIEKKNPVINIVTNEKDVKCPLNFVENMSEDEYENEVSLLEHVQSYHNDLNESEMINDDRNKNKNVTTLSDKEEEQEEEVVDFDKSVNTSDQVKFFNSFNSQHVLVLIKSKLHFNGCLKVTLIAGKAECFGYEFITDKTVIACSPRGQSFLYLSTIKTKDKKNKSNNVMKEFQEKLNRIKDFFHKDHLKSIIKQFNYNNDSLFLLERAIINKTDMADRYMREGIFPNIEKHSKYMNSTELILHTHFYLTREKELYISRDWKDIKIHNNTNKTIVIGGKGVGKSTFIRYLINQNLPKFNEILLIDLDIGQPELFLPQTISVSLVKIPILGAGCFQNIQPEYSLLFGDINVLVSPIKYIKCVINLIKFCEQKYQNIPWLINTMGYNFGFGNEIIVFLLKLIKPTNVIQIQSPQETENFSNVFDSEFLNSFKSNIYSIESEILTKHYDYEINVIKSMAKIKVYKNWEISPSDMRYLIILCHLGSIIQHNENWLTNVVPFQASLDTLKIYSTIGEIKKENYMDLLNASLVYLCRTDNEYNETSIECLGIGIVRSVDIFNNNIYLIPSVSGEILKFVNTLVLTCIPLPSSIYLEQSLTINDTTIPYTTKTKEMHIGMKEVSKSYYRPKPE